MFSAFTRNRGIATLLVAAAAITACDNLDSPIVPRAGSEELVLSLKVSSMIADPGERISVALDPEFGGTLAGVSGDVHFNSTKLRYVGQTVDDGIIMVNTKGAGEGLLRIAAAHQTGFAGDIGSLVFEVMGGDYLSTISFDASDAMALHADGARKIKDITVSRWAGEDRYLKVGEATIMTSDDWMRRLMPGRDTKFGTTFARPGDLAVPNLVYGDVNLSGGTTPVDLDDVIFLLNVTVGNLELIIDADSTTFGGAGAGRRDAVIAGNVDPINSPGLGEVGDALRPGINAPGDFGQIDLGDVIVVLNEIVNPAGQPVAGEIIPGRAPTTPGRVVVSANITTNTTWTSNNVYELQGGILVTGGATLTIQPGTVIEGQRGTGPGVGGAALFVQRDGRLVADGTPLQPIKFTCTGTPKAKGCWGGLVINGNAGLNEGTGTSPIIAGRATTGMCLEKTGEGNSGLYGGCNDADSSGVLRYAIVEYSGFRFTTTNELNGIALQGVGSGTVVDFVQVHGGQDDSFELFGGTVNLKHLLLTAGSDDQLDWTEGWRGKAQFIIAQADSLDGDKGIEADGNSTAFGATPIANPKIWNMTIIGKFSPAGTGGADPNNNIEGGMHIRRGTRPDFNNFIVMGFPHMLDIDDTETCVTDANSAAFSMKNSSFQFYTTVNNTDGSDPAGCGSEEVFLAQGAFANQIAANGTATVVTLLAPYNVMTPDFRPAFGQASGGGTPPSDGFFDTSATYKGAVPPANSAKANIPWYAGWSRPWQNPTTP
jgi:hypothetical protein